MEQQQQEVQNVEELGVEELEGVQEMQAVVGLRLREAVRYFLCS